MEEFKVIGKSVPRVDALEKVTGQAKYTVDVKLPRMLYIKILRSPHAHAKILGIDISKAKKLAGVHVVATGKDAPDEKLYALQDRYVLARDVVRFVGEPVAAVAADTVDIAEDALELIDVEYESLPAIFDQEEALKPNPSVIVTTNVRTRYFSPYYHGRDPSKTPANAIAVERPNVLSYYKVRKGDAEKGFKEADLIVSERYVRPRMNHCCMEPSAAVVQPQPDGGVTVWATTQTLYPEKEIICRVFNLSPSKVRMIGLYMGGGFGSRVEGLGVYIYIAILLARMAKRPVKLVYTRDETFIDGITEMPQVIYIKDGLKKDGTLVARQVKLVINGGAYSGNNVVGAYNATFAASGTYRIPNFWSDSYVVATNEPVAGPFRGFGANPPEWAVECHMDLDAEKLGMDPVEFRRKNVLKDGDENGVGEITYNCEIQNSIDKVVNSIQWDKKPPVEAGPWKRGLGVACSNKLTTGSNFASVVIVKVYPDAVIEVRHSARDLGQGCNTALSQIAAEEFATSVDRIKIVACDSLVTPTDHGTISNRVTYHTGNALRIACADAKRQILDRASAVL
ncbi:MAG: xanthine dehydrogenase family protein molybdopterin-binding subunit, partial [Dehalococcoidia bacterium]|nr:xanthine dehydrogenase family protein molybdopterin-binding subunit [Dehalococcoidia bacterium]